MRYNKHNITVGTVHSIMSDLEQNFGKGMHFHHQALRGRKVTTFEVLNSGAAVDSSVGMSRGVA